MVKKSLKKILAFILGTDENFSFENRVLLSSIVLGLLMSLLAIVYVIIIPDQKLAKYITFLVFFSLASLYYLARFRKIFRSLIIPFIGLVLAGIGITWILEGGITGTNMLVSFIILLLGLIVIPEKARRIVIAMFILLLIWIYIMQIYYPSFIGKLHNVDADWDVNIITVICSTIFLYLTVNFLLKHSANERMRVEESEMKMRDLVDNIGEGVGMVDPAEKFFFVNPVAEKIFGVRRGELLGKSLSEFLSEEEYKSVVNQTGQRSIGKSDNYDLKIRLRSGAIRNINITAVPQFDNKGKFMATLGIFRDISEKKNAEDRLRESEEKYRLLLTNIRDVIYAVDIESQEFKFLSPSFEQITGYSTEDIRNMGGRAVFLQKVVNQQKYSEWDNFLHQLNVEDSLVDFNYETQWLCKDGNYKYLNDHWIPIFVDGKLYSTYGVLTDITDRKIAEASLARKMEELNNAYSELEKFTYANQELKQFVFLASHQLQEPIRTVTNFSQVIKEDYGGILDSNGLNYLQTIQNATLRMGDLINTLLEFSQLGRNKKLVIVDIRHLLDTVISDLTVLINSTEAVIEISDMPVINCYEVEIRQLFQNLITNSLKFQNENNHPKINIRSKKQNNNWQFSISDNGIGISPDYFEKIFEIFQRLHASEDTYEGKGIGLAYCKKIVQMHFGEIWVESAEGMGTTFYFTIALNLEKS